MTTKSTLFFIVVILAFSFLVGFGNAGTITLTGNLASISKERIEVIARSVSDDSRTGCRADIGVYFDPKPSGVFANEGLCTESSYTGSTLDSKPIGLFVSDRIRTDCEADIGFCCVASTGFCPDPKSY